MMPSPPNGAIAGGDARPGGAGGYDGRQLQRELREWTTSADDLRRRLAQNGLNPGDLEAAIGDLRGLQFGDKLEPKGLDQLKTSVERLKRFEFELLKKVNGEGQQLFLSGSDEVPAGFRAAIEEYYRALARRPAR